MEECEADEYDPTIPSLLSMADAFLGQSLPKVPESVRCLMAILAQNPPSRIEARTRLQLGLTLYHHTNNLLEAREHLDKAVLVAQSGANLEEVRFEATSVSARILVEQQCFHQAKSLLRGRVDSSTHYPYWHLRLLLQLADVSMSERDEGGVVSTLNRCAEYAKQVDAPYTRLLCNLYKGAFLLTHHRYQEAGEVLNHTSGLMEEYHGDKETLIRTFYLIVQVSHLLVAGQVKVAKPHLKQLQQRVKVLSAADQQSQTHFPTAKNSMDSRLLAENFQWLTREQTFVMVYLVSVMHSVQGGYMDKALSYAEKAMHFMPSNDKDSGVVSVLRAHLLEQIIQCLLMKGDTAASAEKIQELLGICHGHSQLIYSHRAVLHSLLGLYAFASDNFNRAAIQFHTALQHTNSGELRVLVSLNLALTYMKQGDPRSSELAALMKSIESDSATDSCQSLRAALHYVRGLYAFIQLKLHEAKRHLRETLLMSNKSDLNRLTTCSLILLGQIFLSIGNTKETLDMVNPAVQLASKIPDKKLQVWATTLLADLYHSTGDQEKELGLRQQSSAIAGEIKSDQSRAMHSEHHNLIQWTVGEWPVTEHQKLTHVTRPPHHQHHHQHHHQRKAHQHSHLDTSSPTTKTSLAFQQNSMPLETQNKKIKLWDLDLTRVNQGLPGEDSTGGEQQAKMSKKDIRINFHHGGSPARNSNNQSPVLSSRDSPVAIKTPELKLKKITPTSSKSVHNLSSFHNNIINQQESDDNKEARDFGAVTETPKYRSNLTKAVSSQPQSLMPSPPPPPSSSSLPPYMPSPNQPAYQSRIEQQQRMLSPPFSHQQQLATPNQQSHHYQQPPPHIQSRSESHGSAVLQQYHPSGGATNSIGHHGLTAQRSPQIPSDSTNNKVNSQGNHQPSLNSIIHQQTPSPQLRMPSQQHIPSPQQHIPSPQQHIPSPQQHIPSPQQHIPSPQQHNPSPQQHIPSPQQNNVSPQLHSHHQPLHLQSLQLQRTPLGSSTQQHQQPSRHHSNKSPLASGAQFLKSPHTPVFQESSEGLQYQQKLMAQQKQLEEERLKQKLVNARQLEHQKLIEHHQQDGLSPYQIGGGGSGGSGGSPQKYFSAQEGDHQRNLLHQHMLHRQQQQQQLLLQQAKIQQQYLLQHSSPIVTHPPGLIQSSNPGLPYMQPTGSGYYNAMNQMGATPPQPPSKSPPQVPHLMHMRPHQMLAQEQNRPLTSEQVPQRSVMMAAMNHHYSPGGTLGALGQGVLVPNGANLAGTPRQQNPTGSPLRHFNPH